MSITLSGGHCCACSVICHHVGPPSYCTLHGRTSPAPVIVPQSPAPENPWVEAYWAKQAQFAEETRRSSELLARAERAEAAIERARALAAHDDHGGGPCQPNCNHHVNAYDLFATLDDAGTDQPTPGVLVDPADLRTLLDQHTGHFHRIPGVWDADNAPGVAGTRCVECAARARLRIVLDRDVPAGTDQPEEFSTPDFGRVSPDTAAMVAKATGGRIRSQNLQVEFEPDPVWVCRKCSGPLVPCETCGKPALCGDSWCADCLPDVPAGTGTDPTGDAADD